MDDAKMRENISEILSEIEKAKADIARIQGRLSAEEEYQKKEFGISSVEEGREKIKKLDKEIEKMREKREKLYSKLQEEIDW